MQLQPTFLLSQKNPMGWLCNQVGICESPTNQLRSRECRRVFFCPWGFRLNLPPELVPVVVFPLLLAAAVAIPLGLLMALVVASHSSQTLHRFLHLMIVQWT